MNENTLIEIVFDEKIEERNQNFYFRYVWKNLSKGWIKLILLTTVFLFLGFYPIKNFDTNLLYYIVKYMGVFLSGYCFISIYQYFNSKKKFKTDLEKIIQELHQKKGKCYIKLSSEEVEFSNPLYTIKCIWNKTSYSLVDDYVIIHTISNLNYVLNKDELGNNDFETVISYLERFSKSK